MDLFEQMTMFVRVVDFGSLMGAARSLELSLPAVSRQLRALEEDLGTNLLVRSTRRLRVTDAGRRWYEHCLRILREVDSARADARETRDVRGTLVVSAPVTIATELLLPAVRELTERHPALDVDLRLEDHPVDLVVEPVDVAVRGGLAPPDSASLIAQPLLRFPRIAVASPKYLRKRGVPRDPSQLARHDCLVQLGGGGALAQWRFVSGEREQSIDAKGRIRTSTTLAIRELARDGAGVALVPEWLVAADLAAGRLRRVLTRWETSPVTVWLLFRVELRNARRVRAFIDAVQDIPRALPGVSPRSRG